MTAGSSAAPVLAVEQLAKTYVLGFFRKKVQAISDVSLEVLPGEIFGLLGPNGAGKTTTLKVLMGLIRPSSGRAELFGGPIGRLEAKRQLGYLPENPYFYEYLSGREFLIFVAKLFGQDRAQARAKAGALLEQVGLADAAELPLRRYSKGMLQRIGLAQALINDPQLVILDEPMSGLDPIGRKDVRELIASLRSQGKTVLFSSHILSDVELLADRVAILARGRTVRAGPLGTLLDAQVLSTEIVLRAPSDALCAALEAAGHNVTLKPGGAQLLAASDAETNAVLELALQHGGQVQQITPRRESLEDLVVKQAQAEQ